MSQSPSQCDHRLLQRSLEDGLTEAQEEFLTGHLDSCVSCCEQLELLAADSGSWSRIEGVLRAETTGVQPVGGAMTTLIRRDVSLAGGTAVDLKPEDFAVDFLQPGKDPNSLGRLNNIEVLSVIGQGGNGIVLKGIQEELNRLVAVKVMAPPLAASAAARQRFAREAQATAAVVHPAVMPILTVHSEGQLPYLVMPYVDCESLQERLDREGCVPVLDVLRIAHQIANGLAAAHAQGLVHRDVKPANILLEKGVDRVMLTDFGLARAVDDATLTRTGLIAGTPQYMSPEQARGESVDTRSDLFSLGSVMYAMCTGRPPFRAETSYGILRRVTDSRQRSVRELNSNVQDWLEEIVNRLLAKSAADRFGSAAETAALLEECIAHVQQPAVCPLPASLTHPPGNVFRSVLAKVAAFAGVCVLVTVLFFSWRAATNTDAQPDRNAGTEGTVQESDTGGPAVDSSVVSDDVWDDSVFDELDRLGSELDAMYSDVSDDSL